ncbi:protein-methionine-sulfoxide reductase heme-binding subunit MsrQ [Rhizobium sp. L1K21]|uniref:protein-methionine-sulfoxide reductase heme-binding subunit MsrQ n=1 Tax=Rhizobium sp. L1K21 TaxID=2954933 RepID=UPI002092CB4E|nr:protein-methionine-sulfoxide reductase heme-binding subunit MsrQ [Rhizobium sp. L1K21]MCO6186370.1 protein-methionine-sulfoxide reductase heme-binding subunit MsrQ [Rhizobium sp. L1K21]
MASTSRNATATSSRPFNWRPVKIWALYVVGLMPAAWYFYLGAVGDLGADPVRTFEHLLGIWALRFILATLAVTPLMVLFNIRLIAYRRALGLLGFWYVLFHFTVYVTLDRGMNLSGIVEDIAKRWYITIGMAGFVMLIPLALTSNTYSIRKLGSRWSKLHKLVYAVVAAGTLHFVLSTKTLTIEQAIYVALTVILLLFRVFKPRIMKWRKQNTMRRKSDQAKA